MEPLALLWILKVYFLALEKGKHKKNIKKETGITKTSSFTWWQKEDIVSVSFDLSEGDIKSPIVTKVCPRKDYIKSVFTFNRYDEDEDIEQIINSFWDNCIIDLEKIKSRPDNVRIWLDRTPEAQCGLLFVADLLKNSETTIHIVELPEKIKRDDHCIVEYRGWGEVDPELFGTFLDRERILTKEEINELSRQWEKLKEENSPLRVFENSVIISVDESYYDNLIRQEFPKGTCKIVNIIENALGNHKILTGDVFIAKRIQHFINTGEFIVIDDGNDRFYDAVVIYAEKS